MATKANEISALLAAAGITNADQLAKVLLKAQEKDTLQKRLTVKRSEKGAISVYGLNSRFPVTLYANQWHRVMTEAMPAIAAMVKAGKFVDKDGNPFTWPDAK